MDYYPNKPERLDLYVQVDVCLHTHTQQLLGEPLRHRDTPEDNDMGLSGKA